MVCLKQKILDGKYFLFLVLDNQDAHKHDRMHKMKYYPIMFTLTAVS